MKTYEIINPSDAYTFEAKDFNVACVCVALLGNGMYGISGSPMIRGWEPFFKGLGIDLDKFIPEKWEEMAECFESILIKTKTAEDRAAVEKQMEGMDTAARARFLDARHDRLRSSQNDIGSRAMDLADRLRTHKGQPKPVPA